MNDSVDSIDYSFWLQLWFDKYKNYEDLKNYITGQENKSKVGDHIIEAFEKLIEEARNQNNVFIKDYCLLASQHLSTIKEYPEYFVDELLLEINKRLMKESASKQTIELENLEHDLRIRVKQNDVNDDFIKENIKSIECGIRYFIRKTKERTLIADLKKLAKILYKSLGYICKLAKCVPDPVKDLYLLLFQHCIYVQQPPPRIIKKQTSNTSGTCFKASLCLLLDEEYFDLSHPVKSYYLNHTLCRETSHHRNALPLVNGTEHFLGSLCSFDKLKVNLGNKRGRVVDDKGIVMFRVQMSAKSFIHEPIHVDVRSKPVVIIAHTSQQADAEAEILCLDHFAVDPQKKPFVTHSEVKIKDFVHAVGKFFEDNTGRDLTTDEKFNLEDKILELNSNKPVVLLSTLLREKCLGKKAKFTFWEWIYSAYRLIKENLLILWKENVIHGFISYKQSFDLFQRSNMSAGSWLLRFSESILGGITITVVDDDHNLLKWNPLTSKELSSSPLSKQILQYVDLKEFVDGRSKEELLVHYLDIGEVCDGYVPRGLRSILPPVPALSTTSCQEDNQTGLEGDFSDLMEFLEPGFLPDQEFSIM